MFRSFISGAYSTFQKHQPIQWTGILSHTAGWLTSSWYPDYMPNPNYKKNSFPSKHSKATEESHVGTLDSKSAELKSDKHEAPRGITIGFVHGTADFKSAFYKVASRIQDSLPEQIKGMRFHSFEKRFQGLSIEAFGEQLVKQIIENGDSDVILVGHSRGGKVIEASLAALKKANVNVHGIISVTAPHGGSWLAGSWVAKPLAYWSDSVEEMKPGSEFLDKTQEEMTASNHPRTFYAAEEDSLVTKDAAVVPQCKDALKVLDRHGHLSILSSWRLAASILEDIKSMVIPKPEEEKVEAPRVEALKSEAIKPEAGQLEAEQPEPALIFENYIPDSNVAAATPRAAM